MSRGNRVWELGGGKRDGLMGGRGDGLMGGRGMDGRVNGREGRD